MKTNVYKYINIFWAPYKKQSDYLVNSYFFLCSLPTQLYSKESLLSLKIKTALHLTYLWLEFGRNFQIHLKKSEVFQQIGFALHTTKMKFLLLVKVFSKFHSFHSESLIRHINIFGGFQNQKSHDYLDNNATFFVSLNNLLKNRTQVLGLRIIRKRLQLPSNKEHKVDYQEHQLLFPLSGKLEVQLVDKELYKLKGKLQLSLLKLQSPSLIGRVFSVQFSFDFRLYLYVLNIFGDYRNRTTKKPIFQYIFSVHIQKQNIRSLFEKQIKHLQIKSRAKIPLSHDALPTNTENKDRMIPIQQLLKIIEKISAYSFSDKIFSQFQYAFSQNLSASLHHFVKHLGYINIFGANNYCAKQPLA
ncbi:MAG: hypothetical protein JSW60_04800 [Thermoplasmatales archaeon]|nr:MAG: hypothetical protein JSW60_04800 [Thermoplasmatales archaeon]